MFFSVADSCAGIIGIIVFQRLIWCYTYGRPLIIALPGPKDSIGLSSVLSDLPIIIPATSAALISPIVSTFVRWKQRKGSLSRWVDQLSRDVVNILQARIQVKGRILFFIFSVQGIIRHSQKLSQATRFTPIVSDRPRCRFGCWSLAASFSSPPFRFSCLLQALL